MVAWSPPPSSPDGAASRDGAASGRAEVARWVRNPPRARAALPRPLTARRLLNRLGRRLRRRGWSVERRYDEALPMLRVYFPGAWCLGESVRVVAGDGGWWYRSSTGELLAPCSQVDLAVSLIASSLERWVSAASSSWGTDGD